MFKKYLTYLGFKNIQEINLKTSKTILRAFKFEEVDIPQLRDTLGRPTLFKPDLFVFVLSDDKAIRINTANNSIMLANSVRAVNSFIEQFED